MCSISIILYEFSKMRDPALWNLDEARIRIQDLKGPEAIQQQVIESVIRLERYKDVEYVCSNDQTNNYAFSTGYAHCLRFHYSDGRSLFVGYNDPP